MADVKPATTPEKAPLQAESVKPTPTQAENDRAAMGEHIANHEPDGSPEEESHLHQAAHAKTAKEKHAGHAGHAAEEKQATAAGTTGYATRQSKPA